MDTGVDGDDEAVEHNNPASSSLTGSSNSSGSMLKYLDDEKEWVMLVNDSDSQECLEILNDMGTHNARFLVRDTPCTFGSSGSSGC
ncbi:protein NLP8-like [Trifolium medium]|uniref:Protein NLP8-like n=1 Tax=Trifolium medium TaxID=97028 RepID=A0A392MLH8_9FABA|nr:protein NLP8-like [Trifolium medium]